jgi:hypothetical protein
MLISLIFAQSVSLVKAEKSTFLIITTFTERRRLLISRISSSHKSEWITKFAQQTAFTCRVTMRMERKAMFILYNKEITEDDEE